jgi:hypothetical protein
LGGNLQASAVTSKRQGAFELDVKSLASYSELNRSLAAGGFTQSLDARVRSGDVLIAGMDIVNAHQYKLSVDQGAVTVSGTIDATGATTGQIDLYAKNGLTLANGAALRAGREYSAANEKGGKVTLGSTAGVLDLRRQQNGGRRRRRR